MLMRGERPTKRPDAQLTHGSRPQRKECPQESLAWDRHRHRKRDPILPDRRDRRVRPPPIADPVIPIAQHLNPHAQPSISSSKATGSNESIVMSDPHSLPIQSAISHMLFSSDESRRTNRQAGPPCAWTWFWDAVPLSQAQMGFKAGRGPVLNSWQVFESAII